MIEQVDLSLHKIPPDNPRRRVGVSSLAQYISFGGKYSNMLKLLCDLKSSDTVLDIGCGCGRVTRDLYGYIKTGSYIGIDVDLELLGWCKKYFIKPNFRFLHADIHNNCYHRKGTIKFNDYRFPLKDESVDVAYAISVFTHADTPWDAYIKDLYRILKPTGKLFITFMLIENTSNKPTPKKIAFIPYKDYQVRNLQKTEAGISSHKSFVEDTFAKAGFVVDKFYWGNWAGKDDYLEHQDIYTFKKA